VSASAALAAALGAEEQATTNEGVGDLMTTEGTGTATAVGELVMEASAD
jgi:hypothetical protein